MRWRKRKKPKHEDCRIIKKFLWLPKCINNEWRFLEMCQIEQKYVHEGIDYAGCEVGCWFDMKWIDKK
jgi:hypothetical protein